MTYYAQINSHNELTGIDMSMLTIDEFGSDDVKNIEVSEDVYINQDKYIYKKGKVVINPDYDAEQLAKAKEEKYQEALEKAEIYLSGEACYRYNENNSIEATDGNIGKFTAYALKLQSGLAQTVTWTTKEDNVIVLDIDGVIDILTGIGEVQADVWNVQFITYKTAINEAVTIEQVEGININYD